MLRLADAMTDAPTDIDDQLFQSLQRNFADGQVVELASAIAWENYRARFNRVFRADSEGFSAGAFCPLPVSRQRDISASDASSGAGSGG